MKRAIKPLMNLIGLACVGLALLLAASPGSARADVVYTYTGNTFTSTSYPYTTADSVNGSMTFTTALAPDLTDVYVYPLLLTLSDGVQIISYCRTKHSTSLFVYKFGRDHRRMASYNGSLYNPLSIDHINC